jgi:hypothetical protein
LENVFRDFTQILQLSTPQPLKWGAKKNHRIDLKVPQMGDLGGCKIKKAIPYRYSLLGYY